MLGLHQFSEQLLVPVLVVPVQVNLEFLVKAVSLDTLFLVLRPIEPFLKMR